MSLHEDRITYLLRQFADNQSSPQEISEMLDLLKKDDESPELESFVNQLSGEVRQEARDYPADWEKIWINIRNQQAEPAKVRQLTWRRVAVAASILLVIGLGGYFLLLKKPEGSTEIVKTGLPGNIKAPATNRAMITLANGEKVYVDSANSGQLTIQGHVKLMKLENGEIAYQTSGGGTGKAMEYNTLFNPRGSRVATIMLTDGSKVWLNAGSSVTYPIAFVGKERKVAVTGEAYFEVAHDAIKPFYVSKGDVQVQVLGTHFNVNAYDDEDHIKVTLLEGSVKVTSGVSQLQTTNYKQQTMLRPGQQAQISQSNIQLINQPDLEQVMAWKNGFFHFGGTKLADLMKQLSRWYDLEVVYAGSVPVRQFGGEISREADLSQVLKILDESKVKCRMEGRKLIVE
jgi:transmembrane sensor